MLYTLTIKLKQHTPLIHFQHDQYGATLRASEVKPKLDKFILNTLSLGQIQKGENDGWIIEKEGKKSILYKMRVKTPISDIEYYDTNEIKPYGSFEKDRQNHINVISVQHGQIADKSKTYQKTKYYFEDSKGQKYIAKCRSRDNKFIYDLKPYPCYFGNMDSDFLDSNEYKRRAITDNTVELVISTKYKSCYQILEETVNYASFFMQTNFGTRHSKGFGSFYLDNSDKYYVKPCARYHFRVDIPNDVDDLDEFLFQKIDLFYKTLRGGINLKDKRKKTSFYFKSCAFLYCKDVLHSQWDKKAVKQHFFRQPLEMQQNNYSFYHDNDTFEPLFWKSDKQFDIRDLLGFSTTEQWLSYHAQIDKSIAIKNPDGTFRSPSKSDVLPVDRMQSPILFKPILLKDNSDNEFYEVFIIDNGTKVGLTDFLSHEMISVKSGPKPFLLPLPKVFTVSQYLEYVFRTIDLKKHVSEEYQDHKYFDELFSIYESIKQNIPKE